MKNLLFITIIILLNINLFGQKKYVEASINNNCETQPGVINIGKNHKAFGFKIVQLNAGNNCYNGSIINDESFIIKNSSGKEIFSGKSSEELKNLKLNGGIYKVYVEGGRGGYVKLEYELKLKIP